MSGRVLREIPCIKLNTLLSCLSDRWEMEKTLKDDTSWTADCSLFFSPLRKGKKKKKCKRKHKRLSKKTHMQFYLKCKNEKLNSYTDSFQKALINTV